ncbi:MAG: hypothetical protein KBF93_09955 [Leptospiraceae bacterium]|nr:hypothetical protein [Leptospiraceae bacterium]
MKFKIFLILSLFVNSFSFVRAEDQVKQGYIEILYSDKVYNLTGNWKFKSGKIKDAYKREYDDSSWDLFPVPSIWLFKNVSNIRNGWYRAHINISSDLKGLPLGYITSNIQEAHRVYFNGVIIGSSGEIDKNGNLKKRNSKSDLYSIHPDLILYDKENILAIEVANYKGGFGGIYNIPYLGEWELVKKKFYRDLMWISSICFLLFLLGIYHFILFLGQKKEKSFLYYSIVSFSFGFFIAINYKINLWLIDSFTIQYILFTLTLGLIGVSLYFLVKSLFDEPIKLYLKYFFRVYFVFVFFQVISVFHADWLALRNFYLLRINLSITLYFFFLTFAIILKSVYLKKPSAKLILLGYIIASPFFMIDVLMTQNIIKISPWFISEGSIVLMLVYAYGIAVKNARTYEKLIRMQKGYKEELKKQVVQKTKEIALANEALTKANELKNRIFSIISHDLRSPLDTLNEIIFLFQKKRYTKENFQKHLEEISLTLKRNRFLLGNLLNWSYARLEEKENFTYQDIDVKIILQEIVEFFLPSANKKGIVINFSSFQISYVRGNENILRAVFMNLISNAIKFTNVSGEIKIDMYTWDKFIVVSISDNGMGMTSDRVNLILSNEEVTSDPGTQREIGTGIGLKLCFDFMKKLNGKIEVESSLGKGSEFKVFIQRSEGVSS